MHQLRWLRKKSNFCVALHSSSLQRTIRTSHSSEFARLEFGAFYFAIKIWLFTRPSTVIRVIKLAYHTMSNRKCYLIQLYSNLKFFLVIQARVRAYHPVKTAAGSSSPSCFLMLLSMLFTQPEDGSHGLFVHKIRSWCSRYGYTICLFLFVVIFHFSLHKT